MLNLSITCGRLLVTDANCPFQTVHNDFEHTKESGTCFVIIPAGHEATQVRGSVTERFNVPGELEAPDSLVHYDEAYHHPSELRFRGSRILTACQRSLPRDPIDPVPHLPRPGRPSSKGCRCIRVCM